MSAANREYKDRLFKFIFGNPENKEWTLSLYNAMNGSHYQDPADIELTTIEDAVYMSMKNDVSFLVDDTMSMYEQQSTYNPNMPMRFLVYAGMVYAGYVETHTSYHRYSTSQQSLPVPKCVCFYNGTDEMPDRVTLRLADSFEVDSEPDISVRVTMLNINHDHNGELMRMCAPLREYAWFVNKVRIGQDCGVGLERAVDAALDEMPDSMGIKTFLVRNRAEVRLMCITEYDEARTFAEWREDAIADGREIGLKMGREEGLKEGREEGLKEGLKEGREGERQRIARLSVVLQKAGRSDELALALADDAVFESLIAEFGIN